MYFGYKKTTFSFIHRGNKAIRIPKYVRRFRIINKYIRHYKSTKKVLE